MAGWAAIPAAERARLLGAAHELLAERADEVAATICADMGAPLRFSRAVQVGTRSRRVERGGTVRRFRSVGYGRELGVHGLEEFLEVKSLQFGPACRAPGSAVGGPEQPPGHPAPACAGTVTGCVASGGDA